MSQVKVAINSKNNQVFTVKDAPSSDGKTYGFYIVDETRVSLEGGFYRSSRRTATITVDESINPGWKAGHCLNGQIVVEESHTPFYEGQAPKINPSTKEVVMVNGRKVYRQSRYTDDLTAKDVLITQGANVIVNNGAPAKTGFALNS